MSITSWLRRSSSPRCTAQRRPGLRVRPRLEVLEDRCVPSTLKVTNLGDSGKGSLRYEIAQAQSNDTIVFDKKLDGGTISLYSGEELSIGKNLTIQGPGASLLTVTSGPYANTTRIFEVHAATVTLSGLTIRNGGGRASVFVSDSPDDGDGGGILNGTGGVLTISGCILAGNTAYYGGGIYNDGSLTVSGCTLSNDSTGYGYGGGIYNANSLIVSGCTLSANTAYDGGGIYNAGTATVSASTLSGNSATGYQSFGGGIYNAGTATVTGCTLSGNSATYGGGIYNAGTLTLTNSAFSGNTPDNIEGTYTDGGGNTFK